MVHDFGHPQHLVGLLCLRRANHLCQLPAAAARQRWRPGCCRPAARAAGHAAAHGMLDAGVAHF
eukprot:scaffold30644_cov15-Tisochrysis_lutea.AAC.1